MEISGLDEKSLKSKKLVFIVLLSLFALRGALLVLSWGLFYKDLVVAPWEDGADLKLSLNIKATLAFSVGVAVLAILIVVVYVVNKLKPSNKFISVVDGLFILADIIVGFVLIASTEYSINTIGKAYWLLVGVVPVILMSIGLILCKNV